MVSIPLYLDTIKIVRSDNKRSNLFDNKKIDKIKL